MDGSEDSANGKVPEHILRRVRALQARAEHESTPPAEREASRQLAADLIARYSIAEDVPTAAAKTRDTTVPNGGKPKRTEPPFARRVALWARSRAIELAIVIVLIVLAVTVWVWSLVLAAAVALLWAVHEYRAARHIRQQ